VDVVIAELEEAQVKLLLTSAGVCNAAIHDALRGMLPKPLQECRALAIPTASYGSSYSTPEGAWRFVSGQQTPIPMTALGWASVGMLELTSLPDIAPERWTAWVQDADVLLVNGGDAAYLAHWMRRSGLEKLLPSLQATLWLGFSAGSMVVTPRIGADFVTWPGAANDKTLGLVDFAIFPHLDHPDLSENTMADAERWAAGIGVPGYAIDDETALRVVDGEVTVVTEGAWRHFPAS